MLNDKMDADDVTQEVMIKIWRNIDNINLLAAKTWIIRTTRNLCIDYLRKRQSVNAKIAVMNNGFEEQIVDEKIEYNPEKNIDIKMASEKLKEAVKELPAKLKSIFLLYEIEGMKYKEISKALEIPINSVKVYLMRARKQLQKDLKSYELQKS